MVYFILSCGYVSTLYPMIAIQRQNLTWNLFRFFMLCHTGFFLLTFSSYPTALGQNSKVVHKLLGIYSTQSFVWCLCNEYELVYHASLQVLFKKIQFNINVVLLAWLSNFRLLVGPVHTVKVKLQRREFLERDLFQGNFVWNAWEGYRNRF